MGSECVLRAKAREADGREPDPLGLGADHRGQLGRIMNPPAARSTSRAVDSPEPGEPAEHSRERRSREIPASLPVGASRFRMNREEVDQWTSPLCLCGTLGVDPGPGCRSQLQRRAVGIVRKPDWDRCVAAIEHAGDRRDPLQPLILLAARGDRVAGEADQWPAEHAGGQFVHPFPHPAPQGFRETGWVACAKRGWT